MKNSMLAIALGTICFLGGRIQAQYEWSNETITVYSPPPVPEINAFEMSGGEITVYHGRGFIHNIHFTALGSGILDVGPWFYCMDREGKWESSVEPKSVPPDIDTVEESNFDHK